MVQRVRKPVVGPNDPAVDFEYMAALVEELMEGEGGLYVLNALARELHKTEVFVSVLESDVRHREGLLDEKYPGWRYRPGPRDPLAKTHRGFRKEKKRTTKRRGKKA